MVKIKCLTHAGVVAILIPGGFYFLLIAFKSNLRFRLEAFVSSSRFCCRKSSEVEKQVISCGFLALITRSFTIFPANEVIGTYCFSLPASRKFSIPRFQRV